MFCKFVGSNTLNYKQLSAYRYNKCSRGYSLDIVLYGPFFSYKSQFLWNELWVIVDKCITLFESRGLAERGQEEEQENEQH